MGMDMHLSIYKPDGLTPIKEDIFNGRCTNWFVKLQGRSYQKEYEYLPTCYGIPNVENKKLKDVMDNDFGYFGFNYITVEDYFNWFEKYSPHLDAGWLTMRDWWLLEAKHIEPTNYDYTLPQDARIEDWKFCVFKAEDDCSEWLYSYLKENADIIHDDDIIVYYFSH